VSGLDGALFSATDVAHLAAQEFAVGCFVEGRDGQRGRIVAALPKRGSLVRWWLVKWAPGATQEIAEPLLAVRS
jgi:hypothetical protein